MNDCILKIIFIYIIIFILVFLNSFIIYFKFLLISLLMVSFFLNQFKCNVMVLYMIY